MNKAFAFCICLVLAVLPAGAKAWTNLARGLAYQKLHVQDGDIAADLHVLRVSTSQLSLRPVFSATPLTAKDMVLNTQALAALNANFFDTESRPLGLVVRDGAVLHPFKGISWWSVFCLKNRQASIIHGKDYKDGRCDQAVQAGPRLVVNGAIPKLKEENSRKTAVGINARGEILLAVSDFRLPIRRLAEIFQKPESSGGLGCLNAINLDGGSSTQLYLHTGRFTLDIPSFVSVPVGLGVYAK